MKRRNWIGIAAAAMVVCATAAFAADTSAPAKEATPTTKPGAVLPIKGNPQSKIYHKSGCQHYSAKGSTVEFKTEADAVKAGYSPCKQCAAKKEPEKKPAAEKAEEAKPAKPATPSTPAASS